MACRCPSRMRSNIYSRVKYLVRCHISHVNWKLDGTFESRAPRHRVLFIAVRCQGDLIFCSSMSLATERRFALAWQARGSRTEWDIESHVTTWGIADIYGFNIVVRICCPTSGYTCRVPPHIHWYLMTSAGSDGVEWLLLPAADDVVDIYIEWCDGNAFVARYENHKSRMRRLRSGNWIKRKKMVSERLGELVNAHGKGQTWHLYWIFISHSRIRNIVRRVPLCSRNWLILSWKTTDNAHVNVTHTQSNRFRYLARWCGESTAGSVHVLACAYTLPLELASTSSANVIATCVRHDFLSQSLDPRLAAPSAFRYAAMRVTAALDRPDSNKFPSKLVWVCVRMTRQLNYRRKYGLLWLSFVCFLCIMSSVSVRCFIQTDYFNENDSTWQLSIVNRTPLTPTLPNISHCDVI